MMVQNERVPPSSSGQMTAQLGYNPGGQHPSFSNNGLHSLPPQQQMGADDGSKYKFQGYRHSDNVQISIDVPFPDHPYLIGPRGRKCQNLMDRLKTLVHFPDCNRRLDGPKLNTVLISGPMKSAEEMRCQLRGRTPIRLNVDLSHASNPSLILRRMEEAVADRSLPFRVNYTDGFAAAVLKTEWRNETLLVRFCNEFLTLANADSRDIYTLALALLPLSNPWNDDVAQWVAGYVREMFGCQFLYPPKEKFVDQAPYYFIRGPSVVSVLKAARFLFGLTMFQISFNLPAHQMPVPSEAIAEWESSLLVHATFEPVYKSPNPSPSSSCFDPSSTPPPVLLFEKVTLRSFEFCINNVYSVRSLLLGYKNTILNGDYDFMEPVVDSVPMDVFSACKHFYPLYSIADEDAIELDPSLTSRQFFAHFYGGPYSIRHSTQPDKDLTMLLMDALNLSGGGDSTGRESGGGEEDGRKQQQLCEPGAGGPLPVSCKPDIKLEEGRPATTVLRDVKNQKRATSI